jgi:hypothetical protein
MWRASKGRYLKHRGPYSKHACQLCVTRAPEPSLTLYYFCGISGLMSESPGEDFLKERGLIQRTSVQRSQLLGCLSCHWSRQCDESSTPAYGYQIMKCTGLKSGVVFPLLKSLENAGVVKSSWEEIDPNTARRPPRRLFSPAETEMGQEFAATLVPPTECPLQNLDQGQTQ